MSNGYIDKIKIIKDIKEIEEVLSPYVPFDRRKAEEIIRKHNLTDKYIGFFNSPLLPGYIRFEDAADSQIIKNLTVIRQYLITKLGENENGQA